MQPSKIWVCGQHTYASIAQRLNLHWTTIRRAILALRDDKCSLDTREVWVNDQHGGRRMGTLYSIPAYADILQRRREIANAAVTPAGHLIYMGRARRIVTREMAEHWKIDLAKVPRSQQHEDRRQHHNSAEDATRAEREAKKQPPRANGPPEAMKTSPGDQPPPMKEPEIPPTVLKEMDDRTSGGVTADLALKFVRSVRDQASKLGLNFVPNAAQLVFVVVNIHQASGKKLVPNGMYFVSSRDRIDKCLKDFAETGGVCPTCRGEQRVANVVRGIGAGTKPCPDCTAQARLAG